MKSLLILKSVSLLTCLLYGMQLSAQTYTIEGNTNPFLAGQPTGTMSKGDMAPSESPFLVPAPIRQGMVIRFTDVSGDVNFVPGGNGPGPEGSFCVFSANDLGISGYNMPASAFLGVFLPGSTNGGAAPPDLDFCASGSTDFEVLSPELYQTFFIGDGLRADGVTQQSFIAPAGATELYLGNCDGFGWFNNSGTYTFTIESGPGLSVFNLVESQVATVLVGGATPGGLVGVGYSLTGGGPTTVNVGGACGMITVGLSAPVQVLGLFTATGSGEVNYSQMVPPGTSGISVWVQAFDFGSCTLTNVVSATIQ